jgi:hypothetical protein
MTRAWAIALLLGSCGPRAASPAPRTTPRPALSGHVLVWNDAVVRGGGTSARVSSERRVAGAVGAWRVVADHGDTVELENVRHDEAKPHCHPGVHMLDEFLITVRADRRDVAPATVWEVERRFDDGTALVIHAGVSVTSDGPLRTVAVDGFRFSVELDDVDVGTSYRPAPLYPDADEVSVVIADGAPLRRCRRAASGWTCSPTPETSAKRVAGVTAGSRAGGGRTTG